MGKLLQRDTYRPQAVEQPPQAMPTDPAVITFMERYAALERRANDLYDQTERQRADIEARDHKIQFLETEYAKMRVERNAYQNGYLSMKVQVSILATTAAAALEEAKREMLRDNIHDDMSNPEIRAKTDEIIENQVVEALGRKFAPVSGVTTEDPGH